MTRSVALCLPLIVGSACMAKIDDPVIGCDDGRQAPALPIDTFEDRGTACISGAVEHGHEVEVDFDLCLSSSCDEVESASCSVEQSGTELIVHAKVSVIHDSERACTEDCGRAATTCNAGALAAGSYTLVYAGQRTDIVVPLAAPACTKAPVIGLADR